MPKVRLSGKVAGAEDPARSTRAKLLYLLFSRGWDVYNGNGDQRITLSNIERKIVESDAFVFTPGVTLEDMFKAISIFVGYQTLDRHLAGKPTVLLNSDGGWDPFFEVLGHLRRMGTIAQDHRCFLHEAGDDEAVVATLESVRHHGVPDAGRTKLETRPTSLDSFERPLPAGHEGNVCVFCSASLSDPGHLSDGEIFGRRLAQNRLGCVSGAGRSGIMGAVVKGSVEAGGWTAGSNVPHIIELEGLPEGLSSFWLKPDIYTRMEIMIQRSDAFVIFPGGAGTVQELLALMIFKQQLNPLMLGKPVVIYNRRTAEGDGFWDPMIGLLREFCRPGDFEVAEALDEILPAVGRGMTRRAVA
jgi:uncharacterized protein (TIGR00730 family)